MLTSTKQDREFNEMLHEHLRQDSSLERCIEWIRNNMNPDDVFSESDLDVWADNNGYVNEE